MWLSKALARLGDGGIRARDGLTSGAEPAAEWDDLVLPLSARQRLHDFVGRVRERVAVRDQWGLGHRHVPAPSIAALFYGSRGTGKTLAAEVVARAVRRHLHQVDLSAVTGRYVGETEKNLRRVFDAADISGAILLFTEADGLFSPRSEMGDAPLRFASLSVVLGPMMEAFSGVIIFVAKHEPAADNPLLANVPFVVGFPFPGPRERLAIWQRVLAPPVRTEGLDLDRLAQLDVTGRQIRDIARRASSDATQLGEPIRMSHLRAAVKDEYDRLGRPLTPSELSGW
jgi:SpoVK/Ycf46/Vps4 family AAA+-type ATPase